MGKRCGQVAEEGDSTKPARRLAARDDLGLCQILLRRFPRLRNAMAQWVPLNNHLQHLNGQRPDPGIAQQPDDNLPLALFAVAVIAEGGQFIADPFERYSTRPLTVQYREQKLRKNADFPAIIPNQISH